MNCTGRASQPDFQIKNRSAAREAAYERVKNPSGKAWTRTGGPSFQMLVINDEPQQTDAGYLVAALVICVTLPFFKRDVLCQLHHRGQVGSSPVRLHSGNFQHATPAEYQHRVINRLGGLRFSLSGPSQ